MIRHDPLSCLAPATEAAPAPPSPAPTPKPRKGKPPPLLRELAAVTDDTLAFLAGGPDQQPGDYERNQKRAAEIRADFTAFCAERPQYSNWRQAWAAYCANQKLFRQSIASVEVTFRPASQKPVPIVSLPASPVQASAPPAIPLWQQRARLRAVRAFSHEP